MVIWHIHSSLIKWLPKLYTDVFIVCKVLSCYLESSLLNLNGFLIFSFFCLNPCLSCALNSEEDYFLYWSWLTVHAFMPISMLYLLQETVVHPAISHLGPEAPVFDVHAIWARRQHLSWCVVRGREKVVVCVCMCVYETPVPAPQSGSHGVWSDGLASNLFPPPPHLTMSVCDPYPGPK